MGVGLGWLVRRIVYESTGTTFALWACAGTGLLAGLVVGGLAGSAAAWTGERVAGAALRRLRPEGPVVEAPPRPVGR